MREKRPNIIVFMTDQQNAVSMDPNGPIKTPNMDKFLKRSLRLTKNYCPSPHCCPSRASFFSGLMPTQHGVWNNVEVSNSLSKDLYDDIILFPEVLKEHGYNNYFSGKWHVSAYQGPLDKGFDEVLFEHTTNYGRIEKEDKSSNKDWERAYYGKENIDDFDEKKEFGKIIRPGYPHYYQFGVNENPFKDTDTVNYACDKISDYNKDEPFFMYIGTTGPHDPYCPPQEFIDMYDINDIKLPESFNDDMLDKPALYRRTRDQFKTLTEGEHKESILRYYAFCTYEDYLFGKVLDTVDKKGIIDDTVIIYLTDHGDYLGAHGLWAKGLPCFKEAYEICGVIGGYDIKKGSECDELAMLTDFFPTILDLANIDIPDGLAGHSIKNLLYGQKLENPRTEIYTQSNGNEIYGIQRAVWNRKWKYVYNSFDYDELYDIENDPNEMKNLFGKEEYECVVKQMCKKMWQYTKDVGDNCTSPYILVSLAPYGPGIIHLDTD